MVNKNENKPKKDYLSSTELATILGVSRITIHKRIKKGDIPAKKIGRNYIISTDFLGGVTKQEVTEQKKEEIKKAVRKTVKEYGETLKLLGKE